MSEINYNPSPGRHQFECTMLDALPRTQAVVRGNSQHRALHGQICFYRMKDGTLVTAEVYGLPTNTKSNIFALHIHEGSSCTGNTSNQFAGGTSDPFASTGGHYNPTRMPHPLHSGDLLPLFGNDGFAYYTFYTQRFKPEDVLGRTIVIHSDPDDFRTQPSGASGTKIACGVITAV